jgi:hypothetical protein
MLETKTGGDIEGLSVIFFVKTANTLVNFLLLISCLLWRNSEQSNKNQANVQLTLSCMQLHDRVLNASDCVWYG